MNYLKFLICWWHKTHVWVRFYDKTGNGFIKCVRCGYDQEK